MGKCSEKTIANRIAEKTNGQMIYISGYRTPVKYAVLQVRCSVCGNDNHMTYHNLTAQYRGCPSCMKRQQEQRAAERAEESRRKEQARRRRLARTEAKKEERAQQLEFHSCPVCGAITTRKKYCSDKCQNKAANATKEAKRRKKIRASMVDKDITVMGLFKRDAGVCYICGTRCNTEDYTIIDGAFVAGDWYPSIDHVVPLAKGGAHSWGNVRLAHRRCNYLKRDKLAEE